MEPGVTQSGRVGRAEARLSLGRWRFMLGGRPTCCESICDALAFRDPRFYDGQGYSRSAFGPHLGAKARRGARAGRGAVRRLLASYGDGFRTPQARSLAEGERAPFVYVRGAEVGCARDGER